MWKKVWGALDSVLSAVGFATLVLVGLRYWRGLPLLPPNLMSAPSAVNVVIPASAPTFAPPAQAAAQAPAQAPGQAAASAQAAAPAAAPAATLAPIAPLVPEGSAGNTAAPWREGSGSGAPSATKSAVSGASAPVYKQAHDWGREVSVTVNASRYVKSIADLAPASASLPQAARKQLQAAQALTKNAEMLLVCNVTVEYSGGEEVTLDQGGFRLVSPERQVYSAVSIPFSTRDLQPLRATLLANGSAKGDLVFAVKRGVQPDEITFDPS